MGGGRWLERKSFRRRGEKEWKVVEGKKGLKMEEGVVGRRWKFQTELGIQRGLEEMRKGGVWEGTTLSGSGEKFN